jgi:leucyl-tRNA synthetase
MYLGGAEHAELQLLYARFWYKGTPFLNILYI